MADIETSDDLKVTLGESTTLTIHRTMTTAYLTKKEIEDWAGYCQTSFKTGNDEMTITDWENLVTSLALGVSGWIDRFCRRTSFYPHDVVEYHDGRGSSGDFGAYVEADRTYLLREQPVLRGTSYTLTIEEDLGSSGPILWTARTERTALAAGDYQVMKRGDFSYLRFITNVPRLGVGNLRFTYSAGYETTDPIIQEIKTIAKEMLTNFLEMKKKSQEADVARWQSTDQAADLLQALGDRVLTDDLKARLLPYQRRASMGKAWR